MSHWYICKPDGSVIDIVNAVNRLEAIKQHCHYLNEPATPDQWNRYRALKYVPLMEKVR